MRALKLIVHLRAMLGDEALDGSLVARAQLGDRAPRVVVKLRHAHSPLLVELARLGHLAAPEAAVLLPLERLERREGAALLHLAHVARDLAALGRRDEVAAVDCALLKVPDDRNHDADEPHVPLRAVLARLRRHLRLDELAQAPLIDVARLGHASERHARALLGAHRADQRRDDVLLRGPAASVAVEQRKERLEERVRRGDEIDRRVKALRRRRRRRGWRRHRGLHCVC